ncbi:MAG: lytic murein transglycosylase [Hyphomicrobiales bacterium]
MTLTRRTVGLGLLTTALAGCTSGGLIDAYSYASTELADDLRPTPNPAYDAWVTAFRARARSQGISEATLDAGFSNAGFLPGVVRRDRNQTEFTRTLEDYLAIAASEERVRNGRAAFQTHRSKLERLEATYGVDAEIITAIWGLESSYGDRRGNISVISSTSTLAFDGRRGRFFERQLMAALRIIENGDIPAHLLTGSWAGAMGHTQFIPTSYEAYAVDFTGDGRRDIWSDDPSDALASAAAYLQQNGWTRGTPWGREVTGSGGGGDIIQPQAGGPRFAVTSNFNVIKRYNNSNSYAIGVGHLADRIAGGGPLQTLFPPDANGMTKDDRKELQERLTALGFDTDGVDGVIGTNSRAAISAYQRSQGLPVTGDPSMDLLRRLRS